MWRTVIGHNLKKEDFKVGRNVLESPEEQEKEGKSGHDQDSCIALMKKTIVYKHTHTCTHTRVHTHGVWV